MANTNYGAFIPTSNVWDVNDIYNIKKIDPQLQELLVRLYQNLNNMALSVNVKDSAFYDNANEFVNGQQWFPNPALNSASSTNATTRQVYRKVVNFGALPNAATKTVAHGLTINSTYTFTRIYGCASDTTNKVYIPLPYASATLINNIELKVDATNAIIITAANYASFTTTYVILEYIKF
jgi:hypothetical protein